MAGEQTPHPAPQRYDGLQRKWAILLALLAITLPAVGAIAYAALAPKIGHLIEIELGSWHLLDQYHPRTSRLVLETGDLHRSLWPDVLFIGCYGAALIIGCFLAMRMAWTRISRTIAVFGIGLSIMVIAADLLEDLFLFLGCPTRTWAFEVAAAASTIKWTCVVPAAVIALAGAALAIVRAIGNRSGKFTDEAKERDKVFRAAVQPPAPKDAGGTASVDTTARWRAAYAVPDVTDEYLRQPSRIAVCLSGGGVRSASVALGALQSLRPKLLEADYVISVSGGGYTSGAFIQALAAPEPASPPVPDDLVRDPNTVLAPGSAEEDHLRRHSSYLADTPARMVVALGLLARGLLATLFLIFAPAIALGVLVGAFYRYVPVAALSEVRIPGGDSSFVRFPQPSNPGLYALAAAVGVALLFWTLSIFLRPYGANTGWSRRKAELCRRISGPTTVVALVVAAFVVGLPTLTWFCAWLYTKLGHGPVVTVGGPLLSVLLSYLATVGSILWKHKDQIPLGTASGGDGTSKKSVTAAVPRSLLQLLLVIAVLALLSLVWLLVFGVSSATHASTQSVITASIIGGIWLFVAAFIDETALSLHPFYRARIASAFAVRVHESSGHRVARAYDPKVVTWLDRYGKVTWNGGAPRYPKVVFAAAANVIDDERTAPGLRAVSYVMTADWIGGPDVGWVETADAIEACPIVLKKDLTVQAAVAISGAAFASAMGRASAWYETLLAISGARLGSWLPHPDYLHRRKVAIGRGNWTLPGLPRVRRFPYLAREILGIHPYNERLLHVTDGGHYENLGLVEALRRRGSEIYVIDASGDSPPSASTFAEAIRLARDELGVRIEPVDPWEIEPGTGEPIKPEDPMSALNHRLSKTPVIRAKIIYPEASGLPAGRRTGDLIFAKARLWPELPYDVLSYAAKNDVFPHDSTADQWFDEGQFAQYKRLGQRIAQEARKSKPPL
jgi:hypothetical protein